MRNATGSKKYLGDAVYAQYDGHGVILTVEDGDDIPREIIYLESVVYHNLIAYVMNLNSLASFVGTEN